jgi:hypothetical protein
MYPDLQRRGCFDENAKRADVVDASFYARACAFIFDFYEERFAL